jgi:hypothetical protein
MASSGVCEGTVVRTMAGFFFGSAAVLAAKQNTIDPTVAAIRPKCFILEQCCRLWDEPKLFNYRSKASDSALYMNDRIASHQIACQMLPLTRSRVSSIVRSMEHAWRFFLTLEM